MDEIKLEPKYESILCEGNAEAESIDRKFSTEELADQVKLELQEIKTEQCEDDVKEEDSISVEDQLIDGKGKIWDTNSFSDMCSHGDINKDVVQFKGLYKDEYTMEIKADTCDTKDESEMDSNHTSQLPTEQCDEAFKNEDVKDVHIENNTHKVDMQNWAEYMRKLKQNVTVDADTFHLNVKPKLKCSSCNYMTHYNANLQVHVNRVHLKLGNFKCPLCDFSTSRKSNIETHVGTVHRRLKCPSCEFNTNRKGRLKDHIDRVHLREKDHKCDMCDFETYTRYALKVHFKQVHKCYKCRVCDYKADERSSIQWHVKVVHKHLANIHLV